MSQENPEWVAPLLRQQAYAPLGGVDWIRRPGQALPVPRWVLVALALVLAAGLLFLGTAVRHTQSLTTLAAISRVDGPCDSAAGACLWRVRFEDSRAAGSVALNDQIFVDALDPAQPRVAAVVKAVEATGEFVVEASDPGAQLPGRANVQVELDRSVASWVAPAARYSDEHASGDAQ